MSNRNKGECTIYFSESRNQWIGQFTKTLAGQRIRKSVYGNTKQEVSEKLLDLRIQMKDIDLIKEKQSNSTGESNSSINSKDGLLSNRARDNKGFISNGTSNSRRYNNYEKESTRYTGRHIKGQYRNERADEKIGGGENQRSVLLSEARFETNGRRTERENYTSKVENGICNILGGIIAISNMVSNSQVNYRHKRRIRRYRTLSKQAMKEYAMKKANSSSFDWEDEISV